MLLVYFSWTGRLAKRHWPGHKCGFTKDCFGDCGSFGVGVGVGVRIGPVHVSCSNVVERVSH